MPVPMNISALPAAFWLQSVQTIGTLGTAAIAVLALRNWKRQDRAKREAEFLDALVEAANAFLNLMAKPLSHIYVARIGMRSHEPGEMGEQAKIAGAIQYIRKAAERHATGLASALEDARPALSDLRWLVTKGQIYGFVDYHQCANAFSLLNKQFERAQAFLTMIQSPTWNFENPEVLELLEKIIVIDENELYSVIETNTLKMLDFVRAAHRRIYA